MARGRPFKVDWKEDEQTLYELYRKERDYQERRRLQALWLLRKGVGLGETAEMVGVNYRTVQKWVSWYRQGGLDEVRGRKQGGSGGVVSRLGEEEMGKLKAKMEEGTFRTIWDAKKWVWEEFEIEYSYWGMRGVFDRMGAKKKVPRPRNPKASEEKQREWKGGKLRDELKEAGYDGGEGVYWADEMRVGLIGQVRRVWAPAGVKIVQKVQHSYKWEYLNLAVNGLTGKLRWAWTEDMKGVSIAGVVREWGKQGLEIVVWDGAPGHHGDSYEDLDVRRIKQPPYSPELNPAGRVFELLRDKVASTKDPKGFTRLFWPEITIFCENSFS